VCPYGFLRPRVAGSPIQRQESYMGVAGGQYFLCRNISLVAFVISQWTAST
jgi:hypothetical protein